METIEIDGYTVNIGIDTEAVNPFTEWGSEPPILVYTGPSNGITISYGSPDSISGFIDLIPGYFFRRGSRMKIINEFLTETTRSFAEHKEDWGCSGKAAFMSILTEEYGSSPDSWGNATEWFDIIERIMKFVGIPCLSTQKSGHNQDDSALILVTLTDEWIAKTGCSIDDAETIMENAADLYASWAFGDVYGISKITDPDGYELEDYVWGFYGSDHEKSGLLSSARDIIESHKHNPPPCCEYCGQKLP